MRLAKAATGSRNYKFGTSKAPTRGKVNPKGYLQREIRNRNQKRAGRGNDGQSDRRSGLAKAALRNSSRYASNKKPGISKPKPPNNPAAIKHAMVSATPAVPNIKINANGQLDLPFDESFGLGLVDYQQEMNSELLDLQQQEQEQAMEFANTKRDLGLQFEDTKRGTLNQNAAQGTAFSSQYAVGASNNARNFNNATNDLNAWNTQARSGFGQQRAGIQNAFNDYIRQAVLRRSMDLAGEAGDLGYGKSKPGQVWNPSDMYKPKSKPKPKPKKKATPKKKSAPKRLKKR